MAEQRPLLALAPMQDIADWSFWKLIGSIGGIDLFFTEYFRVHSTSRLDRDILRCVTENPTGGLVVAQLIGEDVAALRRTARELQSFPVAAIDFNLGCPAPIVCRKYVGGGLLRKPEHIDRILGGLREAISIPFTVKTRIGYQSVNELDELIEVYKKHALDLITVHGRTVRQMYRDPVDYEAIKMAVCSLPFPVLANGSIDSARKAMNVLASTGARGLMLGRSAVRNPWIFRQIQQFMRNEPVTRPSGHDVWNYLMTLYETVSAPEHKPLARIERFKKYLNFISPGIDSEGHFDYRAKRITTEQDLKALCAEFLDHDQPMHLEPGMP